MKFNGKGDGEGRSVSGLLNELEPNGRVQYKAYRYGKPKNLGCIPATPCRYAYYTFQSFCPF